MSLWVLGLLIMGACMAYYVLVLADKQENNTIKQMGYLVGTISIAAIFFSTILRLYYVFDALTKV